MAWVLGVIYTDGCLHASTQAKGQSKSAKIGKLRLREQVELANYGDVTAQFYLAAMYGHPLTSQHFFLGGRHQVRAFVARECAFAGR